MATRELIALLVAFVVGAAVERYRQGRRRRPLRLSDTPRAWADTVHHSIGETRAIAAALAVAGALAVLLLPSLSGAPSGALHPGAAALDPASKTVPQLEVARRHAGRPFTIAGLSFRVFRIHDPAVAALQRPAGRGRAWVSVGVDVRNVGRRRFRPNALAYRLRDGRRRSYWPDIGGGTGPVSLAQKGYLERGGLASARLRFRLPRGARRLTLVFEPGGGDTRQVRVPLGSGAR